MPSLLRKPPGKSPAKIPALLASNGLLYALLVTSQHIAKSFQVSHRVVLKVIPLLLGFTFVAIDHLSGLRSKTRKTLLALFCLGVPASAGAGAVNLSVGGGLLNLVNLGLGYDVNERISVEGYLGSSLIIGTTSAYLDYNHRATPSKILKVGAGPSLSYACGHGGCGSSVGLDARVKYLGFWNPANSFGYYFDFGAHVGRGNLFGTDLTFLPHLSLGLAWRP